MTLLQKLINSLYVPDANGNYEANSEEEAKKLIHATTTAMYGFANNLVNNFEEDEALALLAEMDFRLDIPNDDFKFYYSVPNCGSSEDPLRLKIEYGDVELGLVKISVCKSVT